jgi:hypothetical protein
MPSDCADPPRDYVSINVVTELLPVIAGNGRRRLCNVASGRNTSHAALAARLRDLTGRRIDFAAGAPMVSHAPIDTARVTNEFGALPCDLMTDLPSLILSQEDGQCSPSKAAWPRDHQTHTLTYAYRLGSASRQGNARNLGGMPRN